MSLLPSVLPSGPAVSDVTTTLAQLEAALALAKVTSPKETAIFICAFQDCHRLYPSRERLMAHRKRDHNNSDDTDRIITWNE
ncbi:hypothetical protein DFH07DRAFT_948583 [Mycena maculata]|uniref:C2H2-type domain-containing protein n=1 Tax=Mycena maculata TaxID=230809 RepID=A0AAD7KHY1_9AGAR|nr:hypothetical protein DFH07DRAFT_948583 [Mycena maculata]